MIVNTQPSAGPGNDLSSAAAAASQGIAVGGRVLVTGGAGLIGSRLVAALLAWGNQVTIIDTVVTATSVPPRDLAQVREHPQLHIDGVDVCSADVCSVDLGRCVSGCDVVYHLAAWAGVGESWSSAFEAYARANILGHHRLIEASEQAGMPRLVLASSASAYGPRQHPDLAVHRIVDAATLAAGDVDGRELVVNEAGGRAVALSKVVRRAGQVMGAHRPPVAAAAAADGGPGSHPWATRAEPRTPDSDLSDRFTRTSLIAGTSPQRPTGRLPRLQTSS